MEEIYKKYDKAFTDLFKQMYEETKGMVSGISCEKVGPNIVGPKGSELFVKFNIW